MNMVNETQFAADAAGLTKRCSQPPAVPMFSFYMISKRTLQFTLAPASGG